MTVARQPVDLVLEGGGVKGIALAGALATLDERGYEPHSVAGTSAGAIVAALLAAGYDAAELRDLVLSLDYRQFQDRAWEDKVPLIERSLSLLLDLGLFEGKRLHGFMRELLAAKGVHTFADLALPGRRGSSAAGDRLGRDDAPAARAPPRRRGARDRAGRARGRARRSHEHEHPDLLRAGPLRQPEDARDAPARRRRHALELPGLAVRLGRRRAARAPDLRAAARRAGSVRPGRGADRAVTDGRPGPAGGDRLPEGARGDRDGGTRPDLPRAGELRPHDPDPHARRPHHRVRPRAERALALYESGRRAAADFLDRWDFEAYVAQFRSGSPRRSRRAAVGAC